MSNDENDVDAGQGGDAGTSSPDKEAGLLAALQAERRGRQSLETQVAELRGTVDTLKQTQSQPKVFTEAELQAAVDNGQTSRTEADRILRTQDIARVKAEVKAEVTADAQTDKRVAAINAEMTKYKTARPNIAQEGTSDRNAVEEEFEYQVTVLQKPRTVETELDSLRAVFGPASKLQPGRERTPETHQDVGSDGGETAGVEGKAPKGLNQDAKTYYGKQIDQGIYKDWDAVTKMLSHASPNSARRLGLG